MINILGSLEINKLLGTSICPMLCQFKDYTIISKRPFCFGKVWWVSIKIQFNRIQWDYDHGGFAPKQLEGEYVNDSFDIQANTWVVRRDNIW